MNDNHSQLESEYKPRLLAPLVAGAAEEHPVVVVTGARQVGKSTMLTRDPRFAGWKYLSFDDFSLLEQARSDPSSLWKGLDRMILDEVQKVPQLLSAVKMAVDRRRQAMRFVLSGSSNLLLMKGVTESLAGRAVSFVLAPMTVGEMRGAPASGILQRLFAGKPLPAPGAPAGRDMILPHLLRGCMPALLSVTPGESTLRWWEGYVATYLERDLRQLSQIDSLVEFRNVMQASALRTGQLLNQTEIARDCKVSQATVHRYLNLLEATCMFQRVSAYTRSRTSRVIKSPRLYFLDPGLTAFLAGIFDADSLANDALAGPLFESFVLLHLSVQCQLMAPRASVFYWRTVGGKEVDFVVEHGRAAIPFEVKLSSTVSHSDAEGLRDFLDKHSRASIGVLVYTGNEVRYLAENIVAMPVGCLF